MQRRTGLVTETGAPRTLVGTPIAVGDLAPDFACIVHDPATYLQSVIGLADTPMAVRVFSIVPSLDTPVCALQTARFDGEVARREGVVAYAVSVDTPYAQVRACRALAGVQVLSDYRPARAFGHAFGVLVEETGELARAVFVVDSVGNVVHAEIVGDLDDHPDYGAALEAVDRALGS